MADLWMGHFDSIATDRRYLAAEDWAKYNRALVTDGIRNGGTCLQVTSGNMLAVKINEGIANMQGYIMRIDKNIDGSFHELKVPSPHNQFKRIDRVIIRLNRSIDTRKIEPMILMGVASSNPKPPDLTRNSVIWELSLARYEVNVGAVNIPQATIIDERFNSNLCGLMNSHLGIDPSHWQADFDEFMELIANNDIDFTADRLNEFNEKLSQLQLMIGTIETSALTKVERSFDNWEMRRGTILTTIVLENGNISQSIKVIIDNFILGTKLIEKDFDGKSGIKETVKWNEYTMTLDNGVKVMFNSITITKETTKTANGILEKII